MPENSTTTARNEQLFDGDEVRRTLAAMLPRRQVTELRVLDATTNNDRWRHTESGYFDDPDELLKSLASVRTAKGIYLVPNPVNSAILARAENRIRKADKGGLTGDGDIQSRRWILVDCDPRRPSGISATDGEREAALKRCHTILAALRDSYGWPDPIVADSGNGGHLLYRIDQPADDGGLVKKCLTALDAKFTDDAVKVDITVHNPGRIWKLYGTRACKGDSTSDRPHRMSRILSVPDQLVVVSREQLEQLAAEAPAAAPHDGNGATYSNNGYIDRFISRHGFEVDGPHPYLDGGRKWTFRTSPLCEHHGDGPFLIQLANGALSAGCHHESCNWTWAALRRKYEPMRYRAAMESDGTEVQQPLEIIPFPILRAQYPTLNPPVIEGLLRESETCNIIANSKSGKSWLAYYVLLCIIVGRAVFGRFATSKGKCLLIDNELHKPTLANRIPAVAQAMGLSPDDYENDLDVVPLRGNLRSMGDLAFELEQIEPGAYRAILFDAKYRFLPPGTSENDNAAETQLYNLLDRIAEHTKAALLLIHHGTKGNQSDKRVTDVGAGAGAQSRAADCHLILRDHDKPGVVVLEAAVRSFAPVEPLALQWQYPLWVPDESVDTSELKGRKSNSEERDREGISRITEALKPGPATPRQLRDKTGIGHDRLMRLLNRMESEGEVSSTETTVRGNDTREYRLRDNPY